MNDEQWFTANPERQARIRAHGKELAKDKQRAVRYLDEAEMQFRSLGPHDPKQRKIIVYRVPADNPMVEEGKASLLTIPMLAFVGEVIPDTDDVLLPMIDEIMKGQIE